MASHECYNNMMWNETVLLKDLLYLVFWTLRGSSKRERRGFGPERYQYLPRRGN